MSPEARSPQRCSAPAPARGGHAEGGGLCLTLSRAPEHPQHKEEMLPWEGKILPGLRGTGGVTAVCH